MRKTLLSLTIAFVLLLSACAGGSGETQTEQTADEAARQVRAACQEAEGCVGTVEVTADYGLRVYEFTLDFSWQREGETVLTVTAPEEIAGLTARIDGDGARLEFDGVSLSTGDLTGEGLTPMELLPALMDYIDGGYVAESVFETMGERETLRMLFRDPEAAAQSGAECVQWFDRTDFTLLRAELFWNGELVLSGNFTDFSLTAPDPPEQGAQ